MPICIFPMLCWKIATCSVCGVVLLLCATFVHFCIFIWLNVYTIYFGPRSHPNPGPSFFWLHWKKYFNVHFKSQNYSCLLDSHPCLGYRNFCCKKISCNKSKIKAVVLMEKLKQHNLGVKFTPAYFFPCHFDSENKLHWQYSLSIRQYSLSIRQRILLM